MQSINDRLQCYMPFFGKWRFKDPPEVLGKGSSGTVYRIWCETSGGMLDAAMKVIAIPRDDAQAQKWRQEAGGTEAGLRRRISEEFEYVKAEIRTLETLKADSHIVCFEDYKIYERSDVPLGWDVLIRMERLVTLQDFLANIDRYPHKRNQKLVLTIWDELLSGLSLCERNHVLHLDIKPENIFYAEPSKDYFKLGDFGVSIRNERESIAGKGTRVGTVDYMSPEMYNFKGSDSRADMYSLALVIYELLNKGRLPFMSSSTADVPRERFNASMRRISGKEDIPAIKGVNSKLMQILLKCLAYDRDERYPNIQQMQAALRAYVYRSDDDGDDDNGSAGNRRKPKMWMIVGASVVGVLGLMMIVLPRMFPAEPDPEDATAALPSASAAYSQAIMIEPSPEAEPSPSPEAEPSPSPKAEPSPSPKAEPSPSPKAEPSPSPKAEPSPSSKAEPSPEAEEEPSPVAVPVSLEVRVTSALTEDQPILKLESTKEVDVSLYHFKAGQAVEIDPQYKANEFSVTGSMSVDLRSGGLAEGDTWVLTYVDDDGVLQQLPVAVAGSQRALLDLEFDGIRTVEGREYPVVVGAYLSGNVVGSAGDFVLYGWQAEGEEVEETTVALDAEGRESFSLYSEDCDIDDRGSVVTLTARYADGLGESRWVSKSVLWTTDEAAELTWRPVMEGDSEIRFETEAGASVRVYRDKQQLGEAVRADENGLCTWRGDVRFAQGDEVSVHTVDAFGNERRDVIPVAAYHTRIDNLQDGCVRGDSASISGTARPGAVVSVLFVNDRDEKTPVGEEIEADANNGSYSVRLDAGSFLDADASVVNCHFEIGNDEDGYISTEDFDWMLRMPLSAEVLTEDSEALVVITEPGAAVTVTTDVQDSGRISFFQNANAALSGKGTYEGRANSGGVFRYAPTNGFRVGTVYTITASAPDSTADSRVSVLEVEVQEAQRTQITAAAKNAIRLDSQELPVVKSDVLLISGTAEPDREIVVRWNADRPFENTVQADASGAFNAVLLASHGIGEAGVAATVTAAYADGKAAGMGCETGPLIWTTDTQAQLTTDVLMEYSSSFNVYTDPGASVVIRKDGEVIASGSADEIGMFVWKIGTELTAGDVYHVECEDEFGNAQATDVSVHRFNLLLDGLEDGALRRSSAALSGVAQPDSKIEIRLRVNDEEYRLQNDLTTDSDGAYAAYYTADALTNAGVAVDGSRAQFVVLCNGERVETEVFTWYNTLSLQLQPDVLTEESRSLEIISEPNAQLVITSAPNGVKGKEIYRGSVGADGVYSYVPANGFACGVSYGITVSDPQDNDRPVGTGMLTVQEAVRAQITVEIPEQRANTASERSESLVAGREMRICGAAEPGQEVVACWTMQGDEAGGASIERRAMVGSDGRYELVLNGGDGIAAEEAYGQVWVRYADNRAQNCNACSDVLLWVMDDTVQLELRPLMEGDTTLHVKTDPYVRVEIFSNGRRVSPEGASADAYGYYRLSLDPPAQAGSAYSVSVQDQYGNENTATVEIAEDTYAPIEISVEPKKQINASTEGISIQGTAQPDTRITLYLNEEPFELSVLDNGTFRISGNIGSIEDLLGESLKIRATYADGHLSRASETITLAVDRSVPVVDVDLSDLSVHTREISGSTERDATVLLRINGEEFRTGSGDGSFSFANLELHDNDVIEIQAWDAAGNYSEPRRAVVGKQEAARITTEMDANQLHVNGWVVCSDISELQLEVGGMLFRLDDSKCIAVNPSELAEELEEFEREGGVLVNTEGKQCVRIVDQTIGVSMLPAGAQELRLVVDDFQETRVLASSTFEKQAGATVVPNLPTIDDVNYACAFGLDDAQPMDGGGILLTGWFYGGSDVDTYTISEVRVVETYADAQTNASDEIIAQTEDALGKFTLDGELQQGYVKLTRRDVSDSCPAELRTRLSSVTPVTENAGFMVWIDEWDWLEDGDYKVAVGILAGGSMYYPSAQLSIRNGEPSITMNRLQSIAGEWAPQSETAAP